MAYYRRLRDIREDHDLTQRQVAAILGMPQPQYNRYEQGLRDVPTTVLIQLVDLYETSTDYLLGRTDDAEMIRKQKRNRTDFYMAETTFGKMYSYTQKCSKIIKTFYGKQTQKGRRSANFLLY